MTKKRIPQNTERFSKRISTSQDMTGKNIRKSQNFAGKRILSDGEMAGRRFQELASGTGNVINNYRNPAEVVDAIARGKKIKMGPKRRMRA